MDYSFLEQSLHDLKEKNLFRTLCVSESGSVDFQSNDYLGLARNIKLQSLVLDDLQQFQGQSLFGSTGSRHISGHSALADHLEHFLAVFHKAEASLLFKSGFEANLAVFSAIPSRGDTVLYDSEIHASVKQGIRLGFAKGIAFKHNDISDLQAKVVKAGGRVFVAVEAVYSMSGDLAPLVQLATYCRSNGLHLIVDEAHSTGLFGPKGEGCCVQDEIEHDVFCRIYTFGKGIGCGGAIVAGSTLLKEYLINRAVPFIYSTSFSPAQLLVIQRHYTFMIENGAIRERLQENVRFFAETFTKVFGNLPANPESFIQAIPCSGAVEAMNLAANLNTAGFLVKAIRPPTVPLGREQLRIVLHAFNNQEEIEHFFDRMKKLL